ncbi:ABC transporter substrate-binding protein [Nocardia sp. SYP-A9097]|uniref:ABC transporter substrate-binding protein n=1 Tax=Nocardia sp. SYP-A9097 TaxID=2663237 RepID=UPI00129AE84E|nr:ABC transporter substrate-binding protein [Nocardia sp. SYP-A9097]MRH87852.1 ABC transporter substrate-binding protein [Nocardia sp. SYP-A9097]
MNSAPGVLDRRRFLRSSGIAALAIFGGGALAACTSAVNQSKGGGDDNAQPVKGGTLNYGVLVDLVPANILTNTGTTPTVVGLVFESLVRYPHDKLEPQPLLAKKWTLAPDGQSITLELRDDVKFHSGRAFTSKDVEFSLRTYADPKWSAQLKSTAAAITGYDTTDPHKIVLTFAHPLGNIFDLLDTAPILDSETIDQLATGDKIVGTGPFRFVQRIPNQRLVFEKNPAYWVPERPYLDRVELNIISDSQAQLNALKSGRIQFADGIGYRDNENLDKTDDFRAIRFEGAELQLYVGANVQDPALAEVRLRQAIAYAIDRDRIITEVFRGAGYTLNLPWPKSSPAFDEARNSRYARDVPKAKQLVSQLPKPPKLPLAYNTAYSTYEATAQIVQANLAEAGIEVELVPTENATFVKQLIGAQFPGLWITDHSWAQFVPSTLAVSAYPFNARKNASHYESPAYVAAADSAWKLPQGTGPDATRAYQSLSDQLLDGLFLIEIGARFYQYGSTRKLHGVNWTKRREGVFTETFLV